MGGPCTFQGLSGPRSQNGFASTRRLAAVSCPAIATAAPWFDGRLRRRRIAADNGWTLAGRRGTRRLCFAFAHQITSVGCRIQILSCTLPRLPKTGQLLGCRIPCAPHSLHQEPAPQGPHPWLKLQPPEPSH